MDNAQEKPKNLLAFDGGASGLPALFTLDEMFYRIDFDSKSDKEIMPYQRFDMISATGPGAIVAILIGNLKLTVPKAIEAYLELASAISNEPAKDDTERKANTERFEKAFKKVMFDTGVDANTPFLNDDGPKILLCTSNTVEASTLYPLRSYRTRSARPVACSILQAACASVASPDRFLPVTVGIGYRKVILTSAMVGYANPTKELLREAEEAFGPGTEVATILSIGAGKASIGVAAEVDKGVGVDEGLRQGTLSSKQVHEEVQMRLGETRIYFRFNIDHALGIEPEEVSAHISDYLSERAVTSRLDDAIKSIESRPKGLLIKDINSVRVVEISLKPRPPLVDNFIGRQDILDAMHRTHITHRLIKPQSPAFTVLSGLGGSGKTQTALKFALEYEKLYVHLIEPINKILIMHRYPSAMIFFLNARSEESLQADLETLIRSRGPEYRTKIFGDALIYLSRDIREWLVILDNADNPSVPLFHYIPTCTHGNVIITTRNSNHTILSPDSSHQLEGLSTEDAVKLILTSSRYDYTNTNREMAERIVLSLGHLPLALSQAGTYIYIHKCLSTYLDLYRKSRGKLLSTLPWKLPSTYPTSVATTIQMSFDKLSQDAQDVMRLFARLDSSSIAHEIIAKAALARFRSVVWTDQSLLKAQTLILADALQQIFCPSGEWLEADFNDVINQCLQYSLLRLTTYGGSKFYSMHILVQSYLQLNQEYVRECEPGRLVVRILGSSILYSNHYTHLAFNLLVAPHARIIRSEDVVEAGDLLAIGNILNDTGNPKLSETYLERCVEMWRSSLGEEDGTTLSAMSHLSISYHEMGRYERSLELDEKVLKIQKQALGADHPNTLKAMLNLAASYRTAGRYQDAIQLVEGLLEVQKRVLGPEDLDTLSTMGNLSNYYGLVGRNTDALQLKREVVNLRAVHLGLENPSTLRERGALAVCYWNVEMKREALELNRLVIESQTRIFGPEHPETLHTIRNQFIFLTGLDMMTEAHKLVETALPAHEKSLGIDHPETIQFKDQIKQLTQTKGSP